MDERGANIDLVFRNGLKDFEVLPPPEVWDNIHPVIKRKQKPIIILRIAALITLILSLSFLAYRLSRELSTVPGNPVMALSEESAIPLISAAVEVPDINASVRNSLNNSSRELFITDIQRKNTNRSQEIMTAPPEIAYTNESNNGISTNERNVLQSPYLATLNSSREHTFEINQPDQLSLSSTKIKVTNRWSVAAMASPTYNSSFNMNGDEISRQIMAAEQPLVSYSGGVAFSYKVNKRFSIQSGLYYASMGQQIDGINSFGGFEKYVYAKGDHNFEVFTASGTVYTKNSDVFLSTVGPADRIVTNYTNDVFDPKKASLKYINNTLHQSFSYLELPVVVRYKVVDKIIDFNVIGGLSYNRLVNNTVFTIGDGGKYPIGETVGLNTVSISSSVGMGMEYSLSDKLSFNLEPTFRYYLNPFNELANSKMHPYSFGVFSGLSYKF